MPNLANTANASSPLLRSSPGRKISKHHHHHHHGKPGSLAHRATKERGRLHPALLTFHRHAISVDETSPLTRDSAHGSQASVTFDPTPEIIDIAPVHKRRERTKRSDTSRKHVLSRQKPIEKEEQHSPKASSHRRNSTMSENSFSSRRAERSRRASSASKTSFDSRCQNPSVSSTVEINDLLPQQSPQKPCSMLYTPSMEKEFRWVVSVWVGGGKIDCSPQIMLKSVFFASPGALMLQQRLIPWNLER